MAELLPASAHTESDHSLQGRQQTSFADKASAKTRPTYCWFAASHAQSIKLKRKPLYRCRSSVGWCDDLRHTATRPGWQRQDEARNSTCASAPTFGLAQNQKD